MGNHPHELPDSVRYRIFDAALAVLVDRGIDDFSVEAVARHAGVNPQLIARHWPGGSRVLLMEAMLTRIRDTVPIPDTGSLSSDLRQFSAALAGLTGTNMGRKWFHRVVPGGRDADLSNVGSDFWAFEMASVEQMFQRAAERGELRADVDEGKAAQMLAAALTYDMVFNDEPTNHQYAELVCRVLLHGMLRHSDTSGLVRDLHESEQVRAVLRATCDGILDPVALVEAVRDSDGRITDFVFREVNPAACTYLRTSRTELLGATVNQTLPALVGSGLFARYTQAMETGEPLVVENFRFFSQRYQTMRRFDLRGMPVGTELLSLVWRDVSERHRTEQDAALAGRILAATKSDAPEVLAEIATAEALRAVADALLDPEVLLEAVRNSSGDIVDFVYGEVNQATCDYLGMARHELIGRGVVETMPGLKGTLLADYIRCLTTGEPLILNDFAYDNEILQDTRRYDLRATRATPQSIALTWRDVTDRYLAAQDLARSRDLLRATTDGMFNPQALVEIVSTPDREVDLVLRDVNKAFCDYIDQERPNLVGQSMLTLFPNVITTGLMAHYVNCAETGEPVILDDVEYFTEFINEPRHFDIRATQVDIGLISLTVRDTTARFQAAQRLADSEQKYRLLAENTSDAVVHGHNGKFLWVSPAIETVLGAPPEYWIGRDMSEMVPPEDRAAFAQRLAYLEEGGTIQRRSRVVAVDGVTHWVHVHAAPFFDDDGRQVGFTSSLRVIDDEVAAENAAEDARQAQADADARYRRLVESAKVATATSSPDGHFQLVNPAMCDLLGYDPQTLLKMNWRDITHPDDLDKATGVVADLIAGRSPAARTIGCYVHADGHRVWGDVSVTCTRTPSGEPEQLTAQIVDVTAQVEAERQLAASEERYRLLAENTGDLVFHVRDGRFAWVSPSVRQVLGASPEYWVGRRVQEVVPPENRSTFAEHQAILAQGGTVLQRVRVLSLDGATHWMHLHARPFRDADGHRDGFIAALRVIDDEVAAQEATGHARAQQARADTLFRRSVENAAIGMCLITPDGRFAEVNDALCRFFGYDAETLTTKTWQELTAPDYLEADLTKVNDVLAGRLESYRMVKQYIHADGKLIWGDLSVSCIRDEHGNVENFISQITDITERVEADEWNRTLSQELQRQNELLHDSEQSYRLLAENATDVVTHVRDGRVVWASPSADQILGAPAEYWVGREVSEVVPRADLDAFARRQAILAQGGSVQERVRVTSLDGVTHWMHLHARPFYDADENQDGFIAALRLIDDEVAAQEAAQEARMREARANALYRTSMQNAAVGMCLARPGGALLEVNEALCAFFGYDAETLLRKTWIELTAPEYLEADLHHVADLVAGRNDSYRMVKQYVHADGHRLWGDLSVGCVRREDGSVEVLIKQITDITVQVEAEERLERLARVDPLTGLVNRREAIARMESALQPAEGPPSHLGVLFCDIDGFKGINDKLGHAAGDLVLSTLASRIRHCVRDSDTVGRMGGDEILVLLPGMPDIDRVNRVAEKIRRHAAEPIRVGGQSITVTLSIGAVIAAPGQTMSTVLARADTAMYAAKARKNAVASSPSGEPS